MSDDEFVAYLKKEGLKEKDRSKLEGMLTIIHDHFMLTVIPAYCLLIFLQITVLEHKLSWK